MADWRTRLARAVEDLPNLGPVMARRLRVIGVLSEDDLRRVGPVAAFAALRARFAQGVSLNALYAMEAALLDVDWRALPPERKAELRIAAALDGSGP